MEKLKRLKVQGFRSLRDVDLELGDRTVLVGANGSGKSNLVAFFRMLSYMMSGDLQVHIARKGGANSVVHYGQKHTPVMTCELSFADERGESDYGFTLSAAAPDSLVFTEERIRFQRHGEPKPFTKHYTIGQHESALLALAKGPAESTLTVVARVYAMRLKGLQVYHFHDTSDTTSIRLNQEIGRNRFLLADGGNLAAFLYRLRGTHQEHYDRIVATVRLAVPFLRDFELEPDAINPNVIQLRWRDRNSTYSFGPHQVSDGSLRAMCLITALLQPEELLPSVIVVDEPELGLHPAAVGIVAALLKAASLKRQIVVATQSPRLLAEFAPADVVVVERREDAAGYGESTFQRLSASELGDWVNDYDLGTLFEMNVTGGGPR